MSLTDEGRMALTAFFKQAYAAGSVSGGLLEASRPNISVEWDKEGEARNSDEHVESSVAKFLEASDILAKRRDDV